MIGNLTGEPVYLKEVQLDADLLWLFEACEDRAAATGRPVREIWAAVVACGDAIRLAQQAYERMNEMVKRQERAQ